MSSRPAYDALATHHARIYNLEHLQAMASWDSMTFMAPSAAPARGAAQAELNSIIHRLQNDPSIDDLIAQAQAEPLDESQAANLEAMRRQQRIARAIPDQLASQRELLVAAASEAWHGARKANDWDNFATALKPLVALVRQEADHLGQALGLSRYDALLERWEPGLRVARVADLFGDVSLWLPELVNQTIERQRSWAFIEPQGPFDAGQQKQVCERVMAALGFDFSAGRLDTSAHPFSGGVPEDVRLTTRFSEANALPSLQGNFFSVDLRRAQAAFEQVPWVRRAVVRRVFPDRLAVRLEEHRVAALWQGAGGDERLVNTYGEVFEANLGDVEDEDLPVFAGPDGTSGLVFALWQRLAPAFADAGYAVERLELSGRGSWRLQTDNAAVVELGRGTPDDVAVRAARFLRTLPQVRARWNAPLEYADLRHADGYALRLRGVGTTAPKAPSNEAAN